MAAESAGILLYKWVGQQIRVLLVHPGGPFWAHKDLGAWSIPKGERIGSEDLEATARREFAEELGCAPAGPMRRLGTIQQRGSKYVVAFAMEGDLDTTAVRSNHFELEWPPRSGRLQSFPEIDRAEWFTLPLARQKINAGQLPLLAELESVCREKRGAE